jgi:DNA-binding transcriptional regulator YiaG
MKGKKATELTPSEFASLRRSHNFTQSYLAVYINEYFTHCTPRTISRWENNRSRMPPYAFKALRALIMYEENQAH